MTFRKIFICLTLFALVLPGWAQNPTTKWPYIYDTFVDGEIFMTDGSNIRKKINIHLRHDKLHYLDFSGIIREMNAENIMLVNIGTEKYICVDGRMLRIDAQNGKGFVAVSILGNFDALRDNAGAYGTTNVASATNRLVSFDVDGSLNQNHMLLLEERDEGIPLTPVKKFFFVTPNAHFPASRSGVEKYLPKEELGLWKAWLKRHKINWKNPSDLSLVLDYLTQ